MSRRPPPPPPPFTSSVAPLFTRVYRPFIARTGTSNGVLTMQQPESVSSFLSTIYMSLSSFSSPYTVSVHIYSPKDAYFHLTSQHRTGCASPILMFGFLVYVWYIHVVVYGMECLRQETNQSYPPSSLIRPHLYNPLLPSLL